MPDLSLEARFEGIVCGVDEAGRGPLAGPVVAAAVILDQSCLHERLVAELDDSKKLTALQREEMFDLLPGCARIGIGTADVEEIDRFNILQATFRAMARAVEALGGGVHWAIVDGNRAPPLSCKVHCVVRGDSLSLSIAAASVVAKVTRDRIMRDLALAHPGYGWESNVGYPTPDHRAALRRLGLTPHHRRSFGTAAIMAGEMAETAGAE